MCFNSTANSSSLKADFEAGQLNEQETIEFFQELIDSGLAWTMPGSYGRTAMAMIRSGKCLLGTEGHQDAYGNYVPSRNEVQPGTPGSQAFVLNSLAS